MRTDSHISVKHFDLLAHRYPKSFPGETRFQKFMNIFIRKESGFLCALVSKLALKPMLQKIARIFARKNYCSPCSRLSKRVSNPGAGNSADFCARKFLFPVYAGFKSKF